MATLTKPSSPGWSGVAVKFRRAKGRAASPFTFQSQAFVWPGSQWLFTFTLPPLDSTQAADWLTFFYGLANGDNTWSENVSAYVPSGIGPSLTLRLAGQGNLAEWDITTAMRFGITIEAEQAL